MTKPVIGVVRPESIRPALLQNIARVLKSLDTAFKVIFYLGSE